MTTRTIILCIVAGLIGACVTRILPEPPATLKADTVLAEEFVLVDDQGDDRAVLGRGGDSWGLYFLDAENPPPAPVSLGLINDVPTLALYGRMPDLDYIVFGVNKQIGPGGTMARGFILFLRSCNDKISPRRPTIVVDLQSSGKFRFKGYWPERILNEIPNTGKDWTIRL